MHVACDPRQSWQKSLLKAQPPAIGSFEFVWSAAPARQGLTDLVQNLTGSLIMLAEMLRDGWPCNSTAPEASEAFEVSSFATSESRRSASWQLRSRSARLLTSWSQEAP